jgi:sugar lactone lactonase YvrE
MPTARVLVGFDADEDRFLPEGPRAVTVQGRDALAWVNIQTAPDATRGAVHLRFWDTGERRRIALPARPGFLFPTDAPNILLVGLEKAVGTLNVVTGVWTPLAKIPDDDPRTIVNDGEIVPGGGAIVFGTKDVRFADPIAALYLLTVADGRLTELAGEQTCSNGKVFATDDEDGMTLYDIDTPTKRVARYRLDVPARTLTPDGIAIDLRSEPAFPDGMRDAGDGTAVIAFYNPHRGGDGVARRYRLGTGDLLDEWVTPGSPRVTCPCLVARDGGVRLVLTTATEGMPADQRATSPHAGSLFVADTTLTALPPAEVVRL